MWKVFGVMEMKEILSHPSLLKELTSFHSTLFLTFFLHLSSLCDHHSFHIHHQDMWDVLKDYPAARVRLEAIAVKRLEKYRKEPLKKSESPIIPLVVHTCQCCLSLFPWLYLTTLHSNSFPSISILFQFFFQTRTRLQEKKKVSWKPFFRFKSLFSCVDTHTYVCVCRNVQSFSVSITSWIALFFCHTFSSNQTKLDRFHVSCLYCPGFGRVVSLRVSASVYMQSLTLFFILFCHLYFCHSFSWTSCLIQFPWEEVDQLLAWLNRRVNSI